MAKKKTDKQYVWVFTAEQAWDGEVADIIVETFGSEDAAQKFMHEFIHEDGDETIDQYVEKHGWDVDEDALDIYRAFLDGYYPTDHIECTIKKCEIK